MKISPFPEVESYPLNMGSTSVAAIDLFCGAGGLSLGLKNAGVEIIAGLDFDPKCEFPYKENLKAQFLLRDVADVKGRELDALWPVEGFRLLAGCAPCQPFSSHRRGLDTSAENSWGLLSHFSRLVSETLPDFVTMENVTGLRFMSVFDGFVSNLKELGYSVSFGVLNGPEFGLPQYRKRLVLLAALRGSISLPKGSKHANNFATVLSTIGSLPILSNGEADPNDPLHKARQLSPLNLKRMRVSKPGGTWRDWPEDLLAPCHRKQSGATFGSFYGRMKFDTPSPTITTQSSNFGSGRFGHPEQDRTITLREAAMLQGFPRDYKFVPNDSKVSMQNVGRLIGNAVPPPFGYAIGVEILKTLG